MKKLLRLAAFAVVLSMLLALVPFSAFAASTLTSKKVVAFGDSLTHRGELDQVLGQDEYGNNIWAYSYPDYLSDIIGTTVYNAGVAGNSTDDALSRIDGEVLGQNPDIIVICFGMNDQSYVTATGTNFTSIETYRKNLELFVSKAKAAGSDVVFLTPNPVCTDSGYYTASSGSNYGRGDLANYCNVMREVAIKTGCSLVDAYRDYSTQTFKNYMIAGDGIHQNITGRQYFASLVGAHLKAIYDGTNKASMNIVCKDVSGKQLAAYTISGASGAKITVASPALGGYTAVTADINTTFVNGATHTFTYSADAITLAQSASKITAPEIDKAVADEFFALYEASKALMAESTVNFEKLSENVTDMKLLLAAKGESEKILSVGASYTTTEPNYGSPVKVKFADDQLRLTDGNKLYARGEDSRYSVWQSNVEVYIDLGSVQAFDVINVYAAGDEWGVGLPESFSAAYSNDGEAYTSIADDLGVKTTTNGVASSTSGTDNIWNTRKLTFSLNAPIEARYVKVWVPLKAVCLWIDEIEVAKKVTPTVYEAQQHNNIISGVDAGTITTGATNLYFGPQTFANDSGNFKWSACLLAKWDAEKEAYIITQVKRCDGNHWNLTVAADEIFLAVHPDGNWYNYYTANDVAQVGQVLSITRMDAANKVAVASQYSVYDYVAPHECAPATDWLSDASYHYKECSCGDRMYTNAHDAGKWVTVKAAEIGVAGSEERQCTVCGYILEQRELPALEDDHECVAVGDWKNDETNHWKECESGHKLNEDAHDQGEWATVTPAGLDQEGKDERRCTVCNYLLEEKTTPATHAPASDDWKNDDTNHWKECGCGEHLEESEHDDGKWEIVKPAEIGVEGKRELRCTVCKYLIEETPIPPLSEDHSCAADGKGWYSDESGHWKACDCGKRIDEDAHKAGEWEIVKQAEIGVEGKKELHCSVCDWLIDEETIPALEESKGIIGDVNMNGKIDARDYLLLKRAFFKTYTLQCSDEIADVNGNGKLDARDYLLLKRAFFGTYVIQ